MVTNSGSRRGFLKSVAAAVPVLEAAASAQSAAAKLPTVRFGKHDVTRLVIGTNPFFGYSHFNSVLDQAMREYMTQEKRIETLLACEKHGINTWQYHFSEQTVADYKVMRERGGKLQFFMLTEGEMSKDFSLVTKFAKLGPIGIAHHGNRTDERFREKRMDVVREFTRIARDSGVMVGVSTHNPEVVDFIESAGWDIDYYMCCFYRVSRSREEARALMGGEAPLGETFLEKDPVRMTKAIRQTKRPVLGFKILGAGRAGYTRDKIEDAFRFAYANIKPTDAVIVGMWPKFKNEVEENTSIARALTAPAAT
jgi:hypothetical protein